MRLPRTMRFALLIFYAAGTLAAPVLNDGAPKATVSSIECKSTRFRQGTTFVYKYDGETINNVEGASTKTTGLQLSAAALITQLEDCQFHMRLINVELRSKSMNQDSYATNAESAALKSSLEKFDLLFTMDGNTITAVKANSEEATEALNIKRAVLSTFQLDGQSGEETDVHGVCKTTVADKDGSIVKSKSLSDCSNRVQNEIGIQSSSIKTESSLKPLESTSGCTYVLDGEKIRSVECEEKHIFRPFSAGYQTTSGAMTFVNQKITLIDEKATAQKLSVISLTSEKSLIFEHSTQEENQATTKLNEQVEEVMSRLIVQSDLSAKQTSAGDFTLLVTLFRKMSQSRMTLVWEKYFDCAQSKVCGADDSNLKDLYRQYMLDAIAYCGTPSCVSVVKDVTISGEVAGERANMFLQSIALVAKTTNSMIRDILDIAEKRPSRQVFLTLGTLISRHCAKTPDECVAQAGNAIVQAENFLEKTLGDCSGQDSHVRVEEIMMVLKAIGNAKRPINARSALVRCAKSAQHTNITMSAFDALRGMPCDESITGELRYIIEDVNMDADTRIYAFQASMRCPEKKNLERLVNQYNLEKNNQLASFMWSYLTNLIESTDPVNKVTKGLLEEITKDNPLKNTNLPFYQYSKHMEKSLYLESIKSGASIRSNLVFHPDGFLPKSAVFDVTAQIMGVPVEVVETAVGIDGIETLLENAMGPNGALPEINMFDWKLTAEKFREMAEKRNAKNRERRAVKPASNDQVNDIHEAINMKPVQPSGFFSMKVMGQTVRMLSYDDIFALVDQIDNMNVIQLLLNVAKKGEKTFSKSVIFLEMTHSVPTGFGLPLKLKLSGTTVATVELNGKFDIRNMFWGKGALDIAGFVKPSAVVEISGSMAIESRFVSSGLLVSSNMIVSNTLKGSINYKEGQIIKLNLDTPSEAVQLFKFSSTPYMFVNAKRDMIEGVPRVIKSDECVKSQLIGYGLCTSVRLPVAFRNYEAPYFPLSGPAHVAVSLVRGDEKLTTFQFLMTMRKNANSLDGVIEMSTPGAVYERRLMGRMRASEVDNVKTVVLSSDNLGKTGSVSLSYNTVTRRTAIETRNNFFTPKDVVSRLVYFNESNLLNQQYGLEASFEYGWYKFIHVTKYVRQATSHAIVTKTTYYPGKENTIKTSIEYNTQDNKITANVAANQLEQEVELSGKLENAVDEKGITITATHKTSGKQAKLYMGIKSGADKIELMTSARMMGKTMKNILGWYKNGGIQSIEDFFLFDGKTAKFVAALENKNGEKALEFSADVLGKKATSSILYTNQGSNKIIEVTVKALKKSASASIVLVNEVDEKSIKIAAAAVGKTAQAKLGYYQTVNITLIKYEADVLGKRVEFFADLKKAGEYRVAGVFGNFVGGVRGEYSGSLSNGKVCEYLYFGTVESSKDVMITCASATDVKQEADVYGKALELSVEIPALQRKAALRSVLRNMGGQITVLAEALYNGKPVLMSNFDINYQKPLNSYVSLKTTVNDVSVEAKAYIQKQNGAINFGIQMSSMGQTFLLLNRYRQVDLTNAKDNKLTTSIVINGDQLPVTTTVSYMQGEGVAGPRFAINVGKYSLAGKAKFYYAGRYGFMYEAIVMKENAVLLKAFDEIIVGVSPSKKELACKFGFTLMGKDYNYGWDVAFEKQKSDTKRAYLIIARVQYATNRVSSLYVSLSDSDRATTVIADVEYIPNKRVRHSFRITKGEGLAGSRLDISIEFLPKMFAKFMTRVEDNDGYQLVTKANLEWNEFKPVLMWTNGYVNNEKTFEVSSGLTQDTFVSVTFDKYSTVTLKASLFGNTATLIGQYKDKDARISFGLNNKLVVVSATWDKKGVTFTATHTPTGQKATFYLGFDRITKSLRLIARSGEKALFDMQPSYSKFVDTYKVALKSINKAVKFDIRTNMANMLSATTQYARFRLNRKENSASVYVEALQTQLKMKYAPKTQEVIFSVKSDKGKCTLVLRADLVDRVLAAHVVLNEARAGLKVGFEKRSVIVKAVAPGLVLKGVATFKDNALRFALKRNNVNEAVFEYVLSKEAFELALKWNNETLAAIARSLTPNMEAARQQTMRIMGQLQKQYASLDLIVLSKEAKAVLLEFFSTIEKAFDQYDFVAAKENASKGLKKLSGVLITAYKSLVVSFNQLKQRIPVSVENVKRVINDIKTAAKEVDLKKAFAKAEKIIPKLRELVEQGTDALNVIKGDLNENLVKITTIVSNVVRNLTDASRPVVAKAIVLLKDFKIRGQRLEDIVKMTRSEGEKYLNLYIEKVTKKVEELRAVAMVKLTNLKAKATIQLNELKLKMTDACNKATAAILKLDVPYTDKTVAQVITLIKETIAQIKQTLKTLNINKLTDALKAKIMKYNVNGKSVAQYLDIAQKKIADLKQNIQLLKDQSEKIVKDLPETTRKSLKNLVAQSRAIIASLDVYVTSAQGYVNEVRVFAGPLTKYIAIVAKSVSKHFGPLADKAFQQILNQPFINIIKVQVEDMKINEIVLNAKSRMDEQVENLKSLSAEQLIDTSVDKSVVIIKEIVAYINKMIADKEIISQKAIESVKKVYNKLTVQYQKVSAKTIEQVTEELLKLKERSTIVAKDVINQVVAMDISQTVWDAWTNANIVGRLEEFNIDERIMRAIQLAKDTNVTDAIAKAIDSVEEFVRATAQQSYTKALENYARIEKAIAYLKSISKKDYDTWVAEMSKFALTNKVELIQTLTRVSEASRVRAIKAYQDMQKLAQVSQDKYAAVAQQWLDVIAEKSKLVYSEVKQPTIDVYQQYNTIIVDFIKVQYETIRKMLTSEFTKLYNDLEGRIAELKATLSQNVGALKEKISELISQLDAVVGGMGKSTIAMYNDFMQKYGDLTWEDVAKKVEGLVMEQYSKSKTVVVAQYKSIVEKVLALEAQIKDQVLNMKGNAIKLSQEAISKVSALMVKIIAKLVELKATATETYKTYETQARMEAQRLILKAKNIAADIQAKVTDIYIQNKDKSLKQVYNEIKKFILENYSNQKALVEALKANNYAKVLEAIKYVKDAKAQAVFMIAQVKENLVAIAPELKYEIESIINQTLRNSVIMSKEIIKAYSPYTIAAKDFTQAYVEVAMKEGTVLVAKVIKLVKEYIEVVKIQAPIIIEQATQLLKLDASKLVESIKMNVASLEKNVRELTEKLMKNEKFVEYVAVVEKKLAALRQLVQQRVEELKANPAFIKLQANIEAKIADTQKLIVEKLEEIKNNPKLAEKKQQIVSTLKAQVAVLESTVAAYRAELSRLLSDARIANVIVTLKQVQASATYSAEKLQENLKPYMIEAVNTLKAQVAQLPTQANQMIVNFANAPEESFWSGVAVTRQTVNNAVLKTTSIEQKEILDACTKFYNDALAFSMGIAIKSTDQWTKQTAITLYIRAKVQISKLEAQYQTLSDQYNELAAKMDNLPAFLKEYYGKNIVIAKALIEEKMLIAKAFAEKTYKGVLTFTTQQIQELKNSWNNSPWKAIVDNQIWEEIITEIKNHELATLVVENAIVVSNSLVSIYADNTVVLGQKYAALKAIIEKQYAVLASTTSQKYTQIKEQVLALNTSELYAKSDKFFAETTIADIVAFIQKQVEAAQVKFNNLKAVYTAKAVELYAKYEIELKKAFNDAKVQILKIVQEYQGKSMKFLMPYISKVVAKVTELKAKLEAIYNKYRPIIESEYKQFATKAIAAYNELKATVEGQYQELEQSASQLAEKVKSQVSNSTAQFRAQFSAVSKMTIRQTIESLVQLQIQAQRIIVTQYNVISARIVEEYRRVEALIKDLTSRIITLQGEMIVQINSFVDQLRKAVELNSIVDEVKQTAIFVYRYYQIEGRLNTLRSFVATEVVRVVDQARRLLEEAKRVAPIIPAALNRYAQVYGEALKKSAQVYAADYKRLSDVYARDAQQYARVALVRANSVSEAVVAGIDYVRSLDINIMSLTDMLEELKKYVTVSFKDGEVSIKIAHANIIPSAMKYIRIARNVVKRTYWQLRSQAKQLLTRVNTQLLALLEQAQELTSQIQRQVMETTAEIRRDVRILFKVNRNISKRIYKVVKAFIEKYYGNALAKLTKAQRNAVVLVNKAQALIKKFVAMVQKVYGDMSTMSAQELYEAFTAFSKTSLNFLKSGAGVAYKTSRAAIEAALKQTISQITARGIQLTKELTPYYASLTKALNDIKSGVSISEALKPIIGDVAPVLAQYKKIIESSIKEAIAQMKGQEIKLNEILKPIMKMLNEIYEKLRAGVPAKEVLKPLLNQLKVATKFNLKLRAKACSVDPTLCKLISEAVNIHRMIMNKYVIRVKSFMSLGKAHMDRAVRKMNKVVTNNNVMGEKYLATAMIMGDHILTFDGKFYDFVDAPKSGCSYLLARDFQDKKFTLRKVDGAIVAETPDMTIKIRDDGRVKATKGNEVSFSLPVESGSSACVRVDNLILCHFKEQQVKITVDLKNFFTIISVSGWYQGKSQGLLGTFNRESHDDWRMPNSKISTNINEFANAYELSGNPKCRIALETDPKKTCNKPASRRCAKTFKASSSPLAGFFNLVDPAPFMEACKLDTKCNKKGSMNKHCKVVAAYVAMLRSEGVWVPHPAECMSDKGHAVNEEWVQKAQKKQLDIVVMVSQRATMKKQRVRIAPLLTHLHRMFKNQSYSVRFSLIGFGGKGIHEPAHSQPLRRGQTVFGYIDDLRRELKSMLFNGEGESSNDAYHAILLSSKLRFRQGAEKAFIMFNSEKHVSHESGPSFDEASYILQRVANAPLFVFDSLNFPSFGNAAGRVIGETTRKLYTTKKLTGVSTTGLVLPASEFKSMALSSKGGLFSNKLKAPKQVAISLFDAVSNWVIADAKLCKRCTLRGSWTGLPRPVCVSDASVTQC